MLRIHTFQAKLIVEWGVIKNNIHTYKFKGTISKKTRVAQREKQHTTFKIFKSRPDYKKRLNTKPNNMKKSRI
jgi:hypothetical protein